MECNTPPSLPPKLCPLLSTSVLWVLSLLASPLAETEVCVRILLPGLGSSPRITVEGPADGEMRLVCSSEGWFPQPRVQWRDSEGKPVPSASEALAQGSDGLFQVEAFLQVTSSSAANVSCCVSNPVLGEERTATFLPSGGYSRSSHRGKKYGAHPDLCLLAVGFPLD